VKAVKENKDTTITFRTSEDLKKRLEVMAAREHRTLSNLIELLGNYIPVRPN
jgi:predicted DNA-binding protein